MAVGARAHEEWTQADTWEDRDGRGTVVWEAVRRAALGGEEGEG